MKTKNRVSNSLEKMVKVAAISSGLYLSSLANPNSIYGQQQDTTIAGKAYRCSPAILTDNIKKRTCVYSDLRIPLVKGEERKVDTLYITEFVRDTVYVASKPDTVVIREVGGEVDLPPIPTAMAPPLEIEAPEDKDSGARFHFNPLGGKNDYQVMGAEAGLVWKFFGVSANYARGFTDVTRNMVIPAPHNRLDIGTDTKSGFNILGAALELHPIPFLFVGAGYNVWNQNREILERKVSMPDSTDLAVNSHSHVEDGTAIRYFGGINVPFSRKVWLKLIGGVYKYDKKDENKLGKPLYFIGVGGSIALK